jgi:tetratricopeptide (TPR) repeat protein
VLDMHKNLVVGIVSQAWFSDLSGKDQDTAFGVNAHVLSLAPLNLPLYTGDLPYPRQLLPAPQQPVPSGIRPATGHDLSRAPQDLGEEWVGRAAMLTELERLVEDPRTRVIGLVGLGGEGKTSLARRWMLRHLETHPTHLAFWWSFYEERSSERFFESLVQFLTGSTFQGSVAGQMQICAGVLHDRPYTLVLDGFEVMQHSDDDRLGRISSESLREFLQFCARSDSQTQVVITTREDLTDLLSLTTYQALDVTRLLPDDGVMLLRETGVKGTDDQLKPIVEQWEGHALTLALLGKYLGERFEGDLAHLNEVPPPTSGEPFYERVARVLRRYNEYMSDAEKTFLLLFSAFRLPVKESAFSKVFRRTTEHTALNALLTTLNNTEFDALVRTLIARRLLRPIPSEGEPAYTAHPLIRAHYAARLTQRPDAANAHQSIANYYQAGAGSISYRPTIDNLSPYIEIVHHLCAAGTYDEAWQVYRENIKQGNRCVVTYILGAYETDLALVTAFFPGGDFSAMPRIDTLRTQSFIIGQVGFCLMNLGRLVEADYFHVWANNLDAKGKDWHNASSGWRNLADLRLQRGDLRSCLDATEEALRLAGKVADINRRQQGMRNSLAYRGWARHLLGEVQNAHIDFGQAEQIEQQINSRNPYLYSQRGIRYAEHLRRIGDADYAHRVTEVNVEICKLDGWADDLSGAYRVLGDLESDIGNQLQALQYYNEALEIARSIQKCSVSIEALIARGRWYAHYGQDVSAAFYDLNEAMSFILQSGYRLYEADARVALAWAYRLKGDNETARQEAETALKLSESMGYHWGQVDAKEVLAEL